MSAAAAAAAAATCGREIPLLLQQVVRRRIAHGIPPCVDPPSVLDCALDAVACGVRQVDTLDQRHGLLQQRAESSEEEGHSHADDHIEENVACAE